MSYGVKYSLSFSNDLNEDYNILFAFKDYPGTAAPLELVGADDVLTIRCTSGDENKLEPILGTEAVIKIAVTETTDITIFDLIAQHDNDILVTVYRQFNTSTPIFQGYIVVEDNFQPFLDPPFTLELRALDGLGLLKGLDLVDTTNTRFTGNLSIIEWIAQIIYKTGQTLPIRVFFNFFHSSFSEALPALDQVFLKSITFSEGDAFNSNSTDPTVDVNATTADDCYTALEKIVRCFRCRLFQEDGVWNLVNLFEYFSQTTCTYTEYTLGAPVSGLIPVTVTGTGSKAFITEIGKEQIIHPAQDDANIFLKLATKWIKLTYNYDQSQNKICNQDFQEGDRDPSLDGTIPDTDNPLLTDTYLAYFLYCWTHVNYSYTSGIGDPSINQTPPTKNAYIRSVLDQIGYEKERYAVIETTNVSSVPTAIISGTFLIDTNDTITFSVDVRLRNSYTNNTIAIPVRVVLFGDDGVKYFLLATPNQTTILNYWSTIDTNNGIQWLYTTEDWQNWTTISLTFKNTLLDGITKVPSGTVQIYLFDIAKDSSTDQETNYKGLSLRINSYLQGGFSELKGDYNYSANGSDIKQTLKEDVEISDSPKRYFKGALMNSTGDVLLTAAWHRRGQIAIDGKIVNGVFIPGLRFTECMERIMYNHLYRMNLKLEGTMRGLVYLDNEDFTIDRPNGFMNSYLLVDTDMTDKKFMLTSFEKDYATGQWRGVFVETAQNMNDNGWTAPDDYKFNYIFK